MADTAVYVYCVIELGSAGRVSGVPAGLPGATRPALLDLGRGLKAVIADVPLSRYGQDKIEAGLRELSWVADIAVAHESVVEYFASRRGATAIPMKLFTMYLSLDRAVRELNASRKTLDAALRRIRGCSEWGIRATRSAAPRATRSRRTTTHAAGGAAFLAAKKRALDDARDAVREAVAAAESAYELLAPFSKVARRRTDAPPSATAPPLLDAAFLVPADRKARFRAAAKRAATACRAAGVELTLSGPWPAYNFVQSAGSAA
jgi:hypothetical protein